MLSMAQFQFFDDTTSPAQGPERIAKLRAEMARRGFDGFVVPRADEHQGEYVPKSAERLAWLTGFTGSAGTAVVLQGEAALVVDGRYTVQAAEQVDTSVITPVQLADSTPEDWIAEHLPPGGVLAYDPWLHTSDGLKQLEEAVKRAGGKLAPVDINLVDVIWIDRPAPPQAPVRPHPLDYAGEAAPAKLERIRKKMAEAKVDALVISDPHNLAWAFNLRGGDVGHTPLPLGYAILPREGRASLFFDPAKVTNEAGDAVGDLADIRADQHLSGRARRPRPDRRQDPHRFGHRRGRPDPAHRGGRRQGRCRRRPDRPHEGGQERGRDRGLARGPSARRRGGRPLPRLARPRGALGQADGDRCGRGARGLPRRDGRA